MTDVTDQNQLYPDPRGTCEGARAGVLFFRSNFDGPETPKTLENAKKISI